MEEDGWGHTELKYGEAEDAIVLQIYESHGGGYMPNEADARLIAAAPELLAALIDVQRVLRLEQSLRPEYGWGKYIHDTIAPAIAKAEGR
jgi:hypothetical protein